MKQYLMMLKQWYKIAKPNKKFWLFQFISVTIPAICEVLEAFFLAKVTTCVSDATYDLAIANLIIAFAILVIRMFSWDFNYRNTYKLVGISYLTIQQQLYDKLIGSSDDNLTTNSKEKLINIMHNDVHDISYFADTICSKFRYLVFSVICIGYIMFANIYIGLIMVAIYVFNIIILNKVNDKIASTTKETKIATDKNFETFGEAIDSKDYVEDLGIKNKVRNKTLDSAYDFVKAKYKYNVAYSYLDNYFYIGYRFIRFALTIAMIFLLKGDLITLTAYFVMVSYIADTLSYNKEFCVLFTSLKTAYVSTLRVNTILNFDDRTKIELGNNSKNNIIGEVDFINVYYTAKKDEFKLNNLYDVNFHINKNECVLFKGDRSCGKRAIFYLLRRLVDVNSGEIYLDKVSLREYSPSIQNENINYVTSKPYFFKDTIMANLKMVNSDEQEIINACKLANVYDSIMNLKEQFNSPVDALSQRNAYLLSVARTLLMHSEIVVFYEFPSYLSAQDAEYVKNVINIIRINHTIIIFSAGNSCNNIADKIYNVEKGTVKLVLDKSSIQTNSVFDALEDIENSKYMPIHSKKSGLKRILKEYAKENIKTKKE